MPRRYIWSDSLTGKEIEGQLYSVTVALEIRAVDNEGNLPKDTKPETAVGEFDLGTVTTDAMRDLVNGDLVAFIIQTRPLVSLSDDSDVVRKWAREAHPEFNVQERGRVPAEVHAAYRREVLAKVNRPDAK